MSLARLVVTAVVVERRSKAEVARTYGLSRTWVHELVKRYEASGEAGLAPRSKRPRSNPNQVHRALEDEIVELRKQLLDDGLRFGPRGRDDLADPDPPRVITPQPQKRPKASLIRFEADQPNERWQADTTHWRLADDTDIEILDIIDDHSRLAVACHAAHRHTPSEAWHARPRATPTGRLAQPHCRVRRDIVNSGRVTLRYNSRLHHIGIGHAHNGTRVLILTADLHIRVITRDGELLRELELDPPATTNPAASNPAHNPPNMKQCRETCVHHVPRHHIGAPNGTPFEPRVRA